MESRKHQGNHDSIKIVTKMLALASLFSIALSCSSLISSLRHELYIYVYSSHGHNFIDKNCMFLLCNGILGLIFRNSSWISGSNEETDPNRENKGEAMESTDVRNSFEEKMDVEAEEKQQMKRETLNGEAEEDQEEALLIAGADEDEERELEIVMVDDDEDDVNDEEEENGLLGTEDLNKKCDEFIRKMREEIKSESLRLIMY